VSSKKLSRRDGLWLVLLVSVAAPTFAGAKDSPARILKGKVPQIPGPRRTIAVGVIDVLGPVANTSVTNVGGPIAAMLSTALSESDGFLVVERDALPSMVTEMELAKSGTSTGNAAPTPGKMIPAQYLVLGSITEYTASGSGSGGGLSLGGATNLTLGESKGGIGLDLRVIDTTTGAVLKSFRVHHSLSATNVGFNSSYKGVPVATNGFFNTPLGDATRQAISDAVVEIAAALAAVPWRGQVVKAEGGLVWVNAGGDTGVAVGDRLAVQKLSETLTDPVTGAVLSQSMADVGVITITNVEPKIAWGTYSTTSGAEPARGDRVVFSR
jgi:curli biogenesis system outer membrane secretion channel CsgG